MTKQTKARTRVRIATTLLATATLMSGAVGLAEELRYGRWLSDMAVEKRTTRPRSGNLMTKGGPRSFAPNGGY